MVKICIVRGFLDASINSGPFVGGVVTDSFVKLVLDKY